MADIGIIIEKEKGTYFLLSNRKTAESGCQSHQSWQFTVMPRVTLVSRWSEAKHTLVAAPSAVSLGVWGLGHKLTSTAKEPQPSSLSQCRTTVLVNSRSGPLVQAVPQQPLCGFSWIMLRPRLWNSSNGDSPTEQREGLASCQPHRVW